MEARGEHPSVAATVYWDVLLLPGLVVLAALFYTLTYNRSSYSHILRADEGYSFAASVRVLHGDVPHRDFTYSYGPLMPYVYAAGFRLFGASLAALRACWAALYVLSIGLSYVLARHVLPPVASFITAALLIGQQHPPLYSYNHVGLVLTVQLLILVAFRFAQQPEQSRWSVAASGLFLIALLIKFSESLVAFLTLGTALVLVAQTARSSPRLAPPAAPSRLLPRLLKIAGAPLLVFALITFILNARLTWSQLLRNFPVLPAYHASVGGFLFVGMLLQSSMQSLVRGAAPWQWYMLWYENSLFAVVMAVLLLVVSVVWFARLALAVRRGQALTVADVRTAVMLLVAVGLYHEFYLTGNHWSTPMYLGFATTAAAYIGWQAMSSLRWVRATCFAVALLLAAGSATIYIRIARSTFSQFLLATPRGEILSSLDSDAAVVAEAVDFLQENTPQNAQVAAFPHDAVLIYLAGRRNALRDDDYQWMLFPTEESDREVVSELDRRKVQVVLLSNFAGVRYGQPVTFGQDYLPATFRYLQEHYREVAVFGSDADAYQVAYLQRSDQPLQSSNWANSGGAQP